MNETLNNIFNRRSNRTFLTEQITEEELNTIIDAGLYAPSAHNQQPWHFTVVQDQELLSQLNTDTKAVAKYFDDKVFHQIAANDEFHIFYHAPTVIIVSGEEKALMPRFDCAAATENMLIAAESIDIGSCWVGLVDFLFQTDKENKYTQELGIPEGYKPYYAVVLGNKKIKNGKAPARRKNTVNYIR
jgi:nitroreductase